MLWNDLDRTVDELGRDGRRWRRLVGGLADHLDELLAEVLRPVLHVPRSPVVLGRFGAGAVLPAAVLTRLAFRDEPARALFAGLAAHTIAPLHHPLTSAIGLVLGATAHRVGWPLAEGGSQQITEALAALLRSSGGEIVTGHRVERLADVDGAGPILFDTTPGALARIAGDALPERYRRRLAGYRHGVGTFKVDYVLDGPVPWADERCGLAGTVHLGGTAAEVAEAEAAVWRGTEPERPFVLVAQPSVVDPGRAPEGLHVLWAYAHTTRASTADRRAAVDAQIERFAPGFAERVVAAVTHDSAQLAAGNANLVGGDIVGGAPTGLQLVFRPVVGRDPYATPNPRLYLCSAATPPGAGVHGMCGYWAAESVLARAR
jgi:phytoene dehydrogenase-like protein